jgi:hypothetical protein
MRERVFASSTIAKRSPPSAVARSAILDPNALSRFAPPGRQCGILFFVPDAVTPITASTIDPRFSTSRTGDFTWRVFSSRGHPQGLA